MVGVAIIGSGCVADAQALACLRLPGVAFAGVLGDPAGGAEPSACLDVPVFGSVDELCETPGVDLVSLCVSARGRRRLVSGLLAAGRSVLLFPPIAASFREVDGLKKLCRRHSVGVTVTHTMRYHPVFARVKEIVSSGCLGAIRQVRVLRRGPAPGRGDELCGGLAYYQDLDLCAWLLGREIETVREDDSALRLTCDGSEAVIEVVPGDTEEVSRTVTVEGRAGRLECDVASPSAIGDTPDRDVCFRVKYEGQKERCVDVPNAVPLLIEFGYRASVVARGEGWICPDLAEGKGVLRLLLMNGAER